MITIQKPSLQDAQAISGIHHLAWHQTYDGILPADRIEEILQSDEGAQIRHFQEVAQGNRPQHLLLVAKDGEDIIGFSDVKKQTGETRIKAIYISKKYQRRGIGSALMEESLRWAREQNVIIAGVVIENRPAIRFFEKHSFTSIGEIESIEGVRITTLIQKPSGV